MWADAHTAARAIVWDKPNGTPESVGERLACRYELVFLLVKQPRYFVDLDPIRAEKGRNPGDVWSVPVRPFRGAHFAVQPVEVASRCIAAGGRPGGVGLGMFSGAGTTAGAARGLSRRFVGVELRAGERRL